MTASKVGTQLWVEGTGNTLASITSDINDTTWIEKISSSPDVYEIKQAVQYFMIRPNAEFTIGDSADYSKNETLQFNATSANRHYFYIYLGSTFNMYGNTTLNYAVGAQPSYIYAWGSVNILGNDTYKPTITKLRRIYFQEQEDNDTYNDIWHLEKMRFWNLYESSSYPIFFNGVGKFRNHIFKDIDFGNDSNDWGYMFYFPYAHNGLENVTFENLTFEHVAVAIYAIYGACAKFKNCTFGYISQLMNYIRSNGSYSYIKSHNNYTDTGRRLGQTFFYFEGCTIEDETSSDCFHISGNAKVLFKNCDWQNTSGYSVDVVYQGMAMMWTGNTFTGGERWIVSYDSAVQWVYGLDLTVTDEDSNPIEDAIVFIKQKDGNEYFTFRTKANGKLENIYDLEVALLTNKHQYGNNSTTNAEYWSDDSNSTYHDVWIMKEGYEVYHTTYVMDQDRSDTIALQTPAGVALVQSNLIDTTISETDLNASVTQTSISTDITEEM